MIATVFFYLFSFVAIASAVMVISSRNPVHSVLFLILCFFNASGLFLLLGAEFLAMILVVVYVGAVAVLFLFVVMMLDVDFVELREGFLNYLPIGATMGLIVLMELVMVVTSWMMAPDGLKSQQPAAIVAISNTEQLGAILYTKYFYAFQISGLVLLVAMVGAIVLTLRHRKDVKRQNISDQIARTPATSVELVGAKPGEGIE